MEDREVQASSIDAEGMKKKIFEYTVWCLVAAWAAGIWLLSRLPVPAGAATARSKLVLSPVLSNHSKCHVKFFFLREAMPWPCLDYMKVPSFFTLSPSHQFLDACIEH